VILRQDVTAHAILLDEHPAAPTGIGEGAGDRAIRRPDPAPPPCGVPGLSYLGFSYGTRIGYTYAEAFPANVRAMVLDGADDPNADPAAAEVAQEAAFQAAFDVFAGWCAQQAQCPLGNDPKSATAKFQRLLAPLLKEPIVARRRPKVGP